MSLKNNYLLDSLKYLALIFVMALCCRVTQGAFVYALGLMAAIFIIQKKIGSAMVFYMLISFLSVTNRVFMGLSPMFLLGAKVANMMVLMAAFFMVGQVRTNRKLPVASLWIYLLFAVISSFDGWFPIISFLKIINFGIMLSVMMMLSKIMQNTDKDLYQIRCVMMAFAMFLIWGSMFARLVPSIGYSMEVQKAANWGIETTGAEVASREGRRMFNGMTYHSQAFGPLIAIIGSWLLCDMLFIERRLVKLHLSLLAIVPVFLYMSRSRTAFVTIAATVMVLLFYALPKANISRQIKGKVMNMFVLLLLLLLAVMAISQIRNQAISKWLRKTDEVKTDQRSLIDAVASSRMGLIEQSLRDFKLNPVFGKGFQVHDWHKIAYQCGAITLFSAPLEKGNLFVMILGEGGLCGAMAFLVFLLAFYSTCMKKRYSCLMTLFTCFLASNLAESMFFAPSGTGGTEWAICSIGAFAVDIIVIRQQEKEKAFASGRMPVAII